MQAQVLAALSRAPLGLSSMRSVARRAGVSPSAAARAFAHLEAQGLAHRVERPTAGGAAVALRASVGAARWLALAPLLEEVALPARGGDGGDALDVDSPFDHRVADERLRALHRAVAERLDEQALARALGWLERHADHVPAPPARRWRELLTLPRDEIAAVITADTPEMRDLRQSSPFAGVVPEPERMQILDAFLRQRRAPRAA